MHNFWLLFYDVTIYDEELEIYFKILHMYFLYVFFTHVLKLIYVFEWNIGHQIKINWKKTSNWHLHACEMIIINYKLNMACILNNVTNSCTLRLLANAHIYMRDLSTWWWHSLIILKTIQDWNAKTIIVNIHVKN